MLRATLALLFFAGCSGASDQPYVPSIPPGSHEISVRRPVAGQAKGVPLAFVSGISDERRDVIRDGGAWESTWQQIFANLVPQPPVPDVDFTTEIVVLASMGTRPSGGFVVLIDGAVETEDKALIVEVTETSPGPDCVVPALVTAPVDALVVPRFEHVSFAERRQTTNCR